jgi:GWxTD domain-containing protein
VSEDEDEEEEAVFDDTVQPIAVLAGATPAGPAGEAENFWLHSSVEANGDLVVLSLPFEGLDVGRYRLVVRAERAGSADSTVTPVRIFWRDMPFSMRDVEFAIDAMRFILTSEEYDKMRSGSDRERQRAFRRYWKQRDGTPDTEHNEMMAEYFRRVDQAYYKFQTLYIRNGIQTDRGKVYVLFGPPEDSHRIMNLEEPVTEVWDYPSLGRSFRFVDKERNGNPQLMEE